MMSCPDFETLDLPEHQQHLLSCDVCMALVQLRSLERPNPRKCEEVEGLLGIFEALSTKDRASLSNHLAICPACTMAAYDTIDYEQQNAPLTSWKGPTMDTSSPQHSIPTAYALAGGLACAALALVVALSVQSSSEVSTASTPAGKSKTPTSLPSKAGANRPSIEPAKQRMNPASMLAWEEEGKSASVSGDFDALLKLCTTTLRVDAGSDKSAYLCALAFGASKTVSVQLVHTIDDQTLQSRATQALAEQRGPHSCDEITCLLDPSLACCTRYSPDKFLLVAEELMTQSMAAVKNKEFAAAAQSAEMALIIDPNHVEAHKISAVVACNLDQFDKGYAHIEKITDPKARSGLTQICDRLGGTAGDNK